MLSTIFLKMLVYLLIRVSLLTGQFSDSSISSFSLCLSCFTSSQSYNIWSVVCFPIFQGHIGLSIILYLYRYDLMRFRVKEDYRIKRDIRECGLHKLTKC